MGLMDFRPLVQVTINGVPLSGFVFSQLSSVRVSDTAGFISDTAEITFANTSPLSRFAMPEPGAEVAIALGYLGEFWQMGLYIADEVEESSPPRMITAVCRAKAQGETQSGFAPISQQKSRSWPAGMTLKAIATTIAGDNGLEPAVTEAAGSIVPGHIDQLDESDLSVLTRIAVLHDLIAKPAGGVLYVGRRAEGVKASGQPTVTVVLQEADVTRWSMRRGLSEATGTIIATYRDLEKAEDVEVKVGDAEPVRRLRQRFRSEEEARAVATAESRRAGRAKETLEVELPGNPSIAAEGRLIPIGFSAAASGVWVVKTATHEVSEGGYRTMAQCERPE